MQVTKIGAHPHEAFLQGREQDAKCLDIGCLDTLHTATKS